jgi:hypothetical protein
VAERQAVLRVVLRAEPQACVALAWDAVVHGVALVPERGGVLAGI